MAEKIPATFRHRIYAEGGSWHCTCGAALEVAQVRPHLHAARRWRYLGVQHWYNADYHMWEHDLTKQRFAWTLERYARENSRPVQP